MKPIGDRPLRAKMMGSKGPARFALRVGEITRVDYQNMLCDIQWVQGSLPAAREVPISGAYWSRRGFLGAMPEEGSMVICGFTASHEDLAIRPYILSYLPNGYITALGFDPFGSAERGSAGNDAPLDMLQRELNGLYGPTRHKMRKLYPGDVYGASDKGAELILDTDARLFDATGAEIWLRAEDQRLIVTTLDTHFTTAASRKRSGRVVRNALTMPTGFKAPPQGTALFEAMVNAGILFEDGTLAPDVDQMPWVPLPSGDKLVLVGPSSIEDPDALIYTEDRVEMQEFTNQRLPAPEHGFDTTTRAPYIERASGTLVGNDPYTLLGRSTYGKPVKPVIFTSASDTQGRPRLEEVSDPAESSLTGAYLYRMTRPDGLGEFFISHDKEGHLFLSIPASTSKKSNLGAGRSVEADIKGSIKAVVGANKGDRSSLDLVTMGGMKWNLGTLTNERSLDVVAKGGIALKVGRDLDGSAITTELSGDMGIAVEGSFGVSTSEDHLIEVGGKSKLSAEGMEVSVGNGDQNTTILSNQSLTVKGQIGRTVGEGIKTTVISASTQSQNAIETNILSGNRETLFGLPAEDNITFATTGSRTIQATGSLKATWQSAGAGDFSFQATTGTYAVTLGAGTINMNASSVNVTGSVNVAIQAPNISVVGRVALGTAGAFLAVPGGIAGPSPYLDPLTGLPITGNPLVNVP